MAKRKKLHGVCYMNGVKFMEMTEGEKPIFYNSQEERNEWAQKIINKSIKPYIENNPDVAKILIECGVLKPIIHKEQSISSI